MRYQHRILQTGSLPLRPDSRRLRVEHRCTSALIWPEGRPPSPDNAVLTDPCFTPTGFAQARRETDALGIDLSSLRHAFFTHGHADHMLHVPPGVERPSIDWFRSVTEELPGFEVIPCPGHSEDSQALVFRDGADRSVWIAGDAVLDREWLLAWGYYWPNGYLREEVIQTWRSVARILDADVIVPGHGEPIVVTPTLCEDLLAAFDRAEYARECGEVREKVRARAER